jgi:hypothetical protein
MFAVDLVVDDTALQALREAHRRIPDAIARYVRRELRPYASQRVDRTLRQAPGPVVYPIQWTSARQRRYVMAKLRADGNLPYQRTGRYVRGWHVEGDYTDVFSGITLRHDWDGATYVGGRQQQAMHQNTGWPNAVEIAQVLSIELTERIEVGLPLVIQQAIAA